jgi:nitrous oxidase accessory protein NosD
VVRFIGGTTSYANPWVSGIESYGPGAKITDNVIYEVRGSGTGTGIGIAVYDRSPAAVVSGNTVANASVAQDPLYVWASDSASTIGIYLGRDARSAVVEANQVTNFATGVSIDGAATVLLSRNAVSGASSGSYLVPSASVYAADNVCDQPSCVVVP